MQASFHCIIREVVKLFTGGRRRRQGTNRRDKMLLNTTMWPAFRPHANSLPRAFKWNAIYYSEDVTFLSPKS